MKRIFLPVALGLLTGCAYYNGVYNAERSARIAEKQWARGEYYAAADSFRASAAHAETVLVRFTKSRWRSQALFLAARGAALGNNCAAAGPRLDAYLRLTGEPALRVDRARVALASCWLEASKPLPADSLLRPLLDHPDLAVRHAAALFSARAALALGDPDRAQALLATIPGGSAAWENLAAAMTAGDYEIAETLLLSRAQIGDWRTEVPNRVRTLWGAGRRAGAVEIVDRYARSRASTNDRATLLLLASDLAVAANDTALARRLALDAQRVGLTATFDAPVAARLLALRLRGASDMIEAREIMRRDSTRARGTPQLVRLEQQVLLLEICLRRTDRVGGGLFLAAEIARDSLRAEALAHALFRQIERDVPESPIAARALVAAAQLVPDSAASYRTRVLATWPTAGVAAYLRGVSPQDSSTQRGEDIALNQAWIVVTNQFADSMKARRLADSVRVADSVAASMRARGRGGW